MSGFVSNTLSRVIKNIARTKTRTLLTMSGIAIGVFAVVIISSIGTIGTNVITGALETMGINSALVEPSEEADEIPLTKYDVECFGELDGVEKAMPLMASMVEARLIEKNVTCCAWGVDEDAKDIISLEAAHGRLIDNADVQSNARVCVIDEVIALETYGRSNIVGKKINLLLGGSFIEYEIVGVAKSGLNTLQNLLQGLIPDFIYIPYSTMQDETGRGTFDKIALLLESERSNEELTDSLKKTVNEIKNTQELTLTNLLQQKSQLTGILETVTIVLSLIAAISLFVSGITVMTTMTVSVNERTREIGIKKSIGAKNRDILLEFLTESVFISVIGGLIGMATAVSVCLVGCLILGVEFAVNIGSVLASFAVSVAIGAVFGAFPASKAAKMKPVDALRVN